MLSKIAAPGDKIEIEKADSEENYQNYEKNEKIFTYFSQIYDIIEEDKLKIAMPTEGTRMISLEKNVKYEIYIFTAQGLYRCRAVMVERYKEDNVHVAIMELYTGVWKYQRRQHYRLECNLELQYRVLTEDETALLLDSETHGFLQGELVGKAWIRGTSLDISAGGIRFISDSPSMDGEHILIEFDIMMGDAMKHFSIVSLRLETRKRPKSKDVYEHRVQFESISQREREELVKFIFEEERRFRKNEKD